MATNIFTITADHAGATLPLRGDMGVALDVVPDAAFWFVVVTKDGGTFSIASTAAPIERLDGTQGSTFSIGGGRNRFAKFMFDTKQQCWVVTDNNLAA